VKFRTNSAMFYLLDSLAIAVFASIGFTEGLAQNGSLMVAIGMATLTAIGGGLIRDAITGQRPQALADPVYPQIVGVAIIGCIAALQLGYYPWTLSCACVLTLYSYHTGLDTIQRK